MRRNHEGWDSESGGFEMSAEYYVVVDPDLDREELCARVTISGVPEVIVSVEKIEAALKLICEVAAEALADDLKLGRVP